jgi:hypothetical protein
MILVVALLIDGGFADPGDGSFRLFILSHLCFQQAILWSLPHISSLRSDITLLVCLPMFFSFSVRS